MVPTKILPKKKKKITKKKKILRDRKEDEKGFKQS